MNLEQLKSERRAKMKQARALFRNLDDKTPEEEARKIERDFNAIMLDVDELRDQIEDEEDRARQNAPDPRRPHHDDGEVRGADDGRPQAPLDKEFSLKPEQRMTEWARARKPDCEFQALGVGAYLRSMAIGAKTDIEKRALAEGTDSSGGYTVPTTLSARLIDNLRAQSVCTRAGAQMVPLTSDNHSIAAVDSDPTPAWRNENEAVNEDDPTFRNVPFAPKSLAVMVKVSRELLEDSINLESALPQIMASAMAVEMDRVCLLGSGSAPEPEGIANATGIGTTAHGAALANYAPLLTARTDILSNNAGPVSAVVMHPRDEGTMSEFMDTTGQPLNMPRQLSELPMLTTTSIPTDGGAGSDESTIFVGNFASLMIGMRHDISILVSRDFALDKLQYTFVAHMRMDVALAHAKSFHTITGVQG